MTKSLRIMNPSPFARKGVVSIPWPEVGFTASIDFDKVSVCDGNNQKLPCQVEKIDPSDPVRDVLVFSLAEEVEPGADDYSHKSASVSVSVSGEITESKPCRRSVYSPPGFVNALSDSVSSSTADYPVQLPEVTSRGVKLKNSRLEVWFNLLPALSNNEAYYAGAATTVILDGTELLDSLAWGGWRKHDPDKRCMQIDRIRMRSPAWEVEPFLDLSLYCKPYYLLQTTVGPVGATVTIVSEPFGYEFADPVTRQQRTMSTRLYRVIRLYGDADFLMEDLFVKGQVNEVEHASSHNLTFEASYCAHLVFGHTPPLYWFENVPDWLAIGSNWVNEYPGYGFATDAHISAPTRDWDGQRRFGWRLGPTQHARCIHVFMRHQRWVESWAGDYWYKFVYKPLGAKLAA